MLEFCPGVGNPLRETGMIQLVQRGQVAWFTTAQLDHDGTALMGLGNSNF